MFIVFMLRFKLRLSRFGVMRSGVLIGDGILNTPLKIGGVLWAELIGLPIIYDAVIGALNNSCKGDLLIGVIIGPLFI